MMYGSDGWKLTGRSVVERERCKWLVRDVFDLVVVDGFTLLGSGETEMNDKPKPLRYEPE